MPTACILIIGNELLSGRTRDVNLGYLARRLTALGIDVAEARVIADDLDTIAGTVNECRRAHDYVFTTGGIGPTHDDITTDAVARAFGVGNVLNPQALTLLKSAYRDEAGAQRGAPAHGAYTGRGAADRQSRSARRRAFRSTTCSSWPGCRASCRRCSRASWTGWSAGRRCCRAPSGSTSQRGTWPGRSNRLQDRYDDVEMGSYPFYRAHKFGCSIVLRGRNSGRLDAAAEELAAIMRDLGGDPIEDEPVEAGSEPAPEPSS